MYLTKYPWSEQNVLKSLVSKMHKKYHRIVNLNSLCCKVIFAEPAQDLSGPDLPKLFEPRHEKTCLCHMRTTKAQISLRIRGVCSAPLLSA